ncbi:hypothetical protein HY407_01470 [Candidatus Gottesmanbacteria bacterium]|nr:hypothetical protein [Candidatus Gottesmanbacteria bacterium]
MFQSQPNRSLTPLILIIFVVAIIIVVAMQATELTPTDDRWLRPGELVTEIRAEIAPLPEDVNLTRIKWSNEPHQLEPHRFWSGRVMEITQSMVRLEYRSPTLQFYIDARCDEECRLNIRDAETLKSYGAFNIIFTDNGIRHEVLLARDEKGWAFVQIMPKR